MGLTQRSLDEVLQFLVDNNFNALRLPFSTKWALDYDRSVYGSFKDGELNGMTRRQILNKVILRGWIDSDSWDCGWGAGWLSTCFVLVADSLTEPVVILQRPHPAVGHRARGRFQHPGDAGLPPPQRPRDPEPVVQVSNMHEWPPLLLPPGRA